MNQPLLDKFQLLEREGIITPIDREFCRFLQQVEPKIDEPVLLAACLVSRAYQSGHVCIKLAEYSAATLFEEASKEMHLTAPSEQEWMQVLQSSSVVGAPGEFKPLILDEAGRLYLQKFWHYEQHLGQHILGKARRKAPSVDIALLKDGLDRLFEKNDERVDWQKVAVSVALRRCLTVISGGPGTGKTTTVLRLIALLLEQGRAQGDEMPSVALAAPTGKAAARLQESITAARNDLQTDAEIKETIPAEASTLHQLLGASRFGARFRYNSENPLPYDWVVIDEVSMVDQVLISRLFDALRDDTRLVLLGDKDQLASVEAGSVLGDICAGLTTNIFSEEISSYLRKLDIHLPDENIESISQPLTDRIILLQKSYRFDADSGINRFCRAVNAGRADEAWAIMNDSQFSGLSFNKIQTNERFEDTFSAAIMQQFKSVQAAGDAAKMLKEYRRLKLLAVHRKGPWGVEVINHKIERMIHRAFATAGNLWYEGRPIIINANDYSLGLSNGDLGVCMRDAAGELKVYFQKGDNIMPITPSRLQNCSTAFALTVHKSQGSEYNNVMILLPEATSRLLSRELLYTAVSRARRQVSIAGNKEAFLAAVNNSTVRQSGLQDLLWS